MVVGLLFEQFPGVIITITDQSGDFVVATNVIVTVITIVIIATVKITAAVCDDILCFNQQYCICWIVLRIAANIIASCGLLLFAQWAFSRH